MMESTITSKGQTTVPAAVREHLGTTAGARLVWHVLPDGRIFVRAKTKSLLDMADSVKPPRGKRVQVEAMNAWR